MNWEPNGTSGSYRCGNYFINKSGGKFMLIHLKRGRLFKGTLAACKEAAAKDVNPYVSKLRAVAGRLLSLSDFCAAVAQG